MLCLFILKKCIKPKYCEIYDKCVLAWKMITSLNFSPQEKSGVFLIIKYHKIQTCRTVWGILLIDYVSLFMLAS